MGNVYFKVLTKTDNPKKKVSIRIRYKNGKIDQSTASGQMVQLRYWDLEKQSFRKINFPGKDKMVAKLKSLEVHVLKKAEAEEIKTGWLVETVDRYLHPGKYRNEDRQNMFDWIENWISKSQNVYRVVRTYHSTLEDMKDFDADADWEDINLNYYDDFVTYLTEKGLAKNTIGGRIKNLKLFCNVSFERNVHNNSIYKSFKKPVEDSYHVYLNEEELKTLSELDFSETPYLDRVRDLFLVGCWTGLRFSDIYKINKNNLDGNFFRIEQQKTKGRVVIPCHSEVARIFKKYDGELPTMISNQKFNTYLKTVCKKAKLNTNVSKGMTIGGKRIIEVKEKWELIASHTARRSFATNLYKSGFPSISIMAITGHKTEKAFLSYIKVSEEEHAEMLMKHWKSKL
jgi:integrase